METQPYFHLDPTKFKSWKKRSNSARRVLYKNLAHNRVNIVKYETEHMRNFFEGSNLCMHYWSPVKHINRYGMHLILPARSMVSKEGEWLLSNVLCFRLGLGVRGTAYIVLPVTPWRGCNVQQIMNKILANVKFVNRKAQQVFPSINSISMILIVVGCWKRKTNNQINVMVDIRASQNFLSLKSMKLRNSFLMMIYMIFRKQSEVINKI